MSDDPDDDPPVHPALADDEAEEPETEDPTAPSTARERAQRHRDTLEMYVNEGDLSGPAVLATIVAHGLLGVMSELRSIGSTLTKLQRDLDKIGTEASRMRRGR